LTLSWTAVSGAASYTVQRANNAAFNGTVTNIATGVTALTQAVTGLTAGATYYFRVVGVNGANSANGAASAAVTTLAATPGIPTGLASSAVTSTGYTLGWNNVTGATGYNVLLNGVVVSANQVGRTYVVTGVTPNTVYGPYTVQACSNAGTTCSAASATPVSVTTSPLAPAAPTATALAATTLTLNWGTPVTGVTYTVQRATNAAFTGAVNSTGTITGASQAVTGLTGNTTYYFRVTATNAGGSTVGSVSTTGALTLPNIPTGVSAANGTTGGAITGGLNWTNPTGGATNYTVSWSGPATNTGSTTTTSGTQVTITGATANQVFAMTVKANNASGSSAATTAVNVTVR
jgi:hypothetical protein